MSQKFFFIHLAHPRFALLGVPVHARVELTLFSPSAIWTDLVDGCLRRRFQRLQLPLSENDKFAC
jgi:hypothetical protein